MPFSFGFSHFFGEVIFSFIVVPLKIMCLYSLDDFFFFILSCLTVILLDVVFFLFIFVDFRVLLESVSWCLLLVFQNPWSLSLQELFFCILFCLFFWGFYCCPKKILKICLIWIFLFLVFLSIFLFLLQSGNDLYFILAALSSESNLLIY